MSKFLIALIAVLTIGAGVANAAQVQRHQGTTGGYDYGLEGGGG